MAPMSRCCWTGQTILLFMLCHHRVSMAPMSRCCWTLFDYNNRIIGFMFRWLLWAGAAEQIPFQLPILISKKKTFLQGPLFLFPQTYFNPKNRWIINDYNTLEGNLLALSSHITLNVMLLYNNLSIHPFDPLRSQLSSRPLAMRNPMLNQNM